MTTKTTLGVNQDGVTKGSLDQVTRVDSDAFSRAARLWISLGELAVALRGNDLLAQRLGQIKDRLKLDPWLRTWGFELWTQIVEGNADGQQIRQQLDAPSGGTITELKSRFPNRSKEHAKPDSYGFFDHLRLCASALAELQRVVPTIDDEIAYTRWRQDAIELDGDIQRFIRKTRYERALRRFDLLDSNYEKMSLLLEKVSTSLAPFQQMPELAPYVPRLTATLTDLASLADDRNWALHKLLPHFTRQTANLSASPFQSTADLAKARPGHHFDLFALELPDPVSELQAQEIWLLRISILELLQPIFADPGSARLEGDLLRAVRDLCEDFSRDWPEEISFQWVEDLNQLQTMPNVVRGFDASLRVARRIAPSIRFPLDPQSPDSTAFFDLFPGIVVDSCKRSPIFAAAEDLGLSLAPPHQGSSAAAADSREILQQTSAACYLLSRFLDSHQIGWLSNWLLDAQRPEAERQELHSLVWAVFDRWAQLPRDLISTHQEDRMQSFVAALGEEGIQVFAGEQRPEARPDLLVVRGTRFFQDRRTIVFPDGDNQRHLVLGSHLSHPLFDFLASKRDFGPLLERLSASSQALEQFETSISDLVAHSQVSGDDSDHEKIRLQIVHKAVLHFESVYLLWKSETADTTLLRSYLIDLFQVIKDDILWPRLSPETLEFDSSFNNLEVPKDYQVDVQAGDEFKGHVSEFTSPSLPNREVCHFTVRGIERLSPACRNLLLLRAVSPLISGARQKMEQTTRLLAKFHLRRCMVLLQVCYFNQQSEERLKDVENGNEKSAPLREMCRQLVDADGGSFVRMLYEVATKSGHPHQQLAISWHKFLLSQLDMLLPNLTENSSDLIWPLSVPTRGTQTKWRVSEDYPIGTCLSSNSDLLPTYNREKAVGTYSLPERLEHTAWPIDWARKSIPKNVLECLKDLVAECRDLEFRRLSSGDDVTPARLSGAATSRLDTCLKFALSVRQEWETREVERLVQLLGKLANVLGATVVPGSLEEEIPHVAPEHIEQTAFLGGEVGSTQLRQFGILNGSPENLPPQYALSAGETPSNYNTLCDLLSQADAPLSTIYDWLLNIPRAVIENGDDKNPRQLESIGADLWAGLHRHRKQIESNLFDQCANLLSGLLSDLGFLFFGELDDFISEFPDYERRFDFQATTSGGGRSMGDARWGRITRVKTQGLERNGTILVLAQVLVEE
ncbi:hypothetical protein [Blastopirellula marina]|uniref:Uncharacterized protein n=1 Tax=Blastopirellula marina TaxID=124 RepID=A0A2S8GNN0_9BACT|nr:hypothetical protein [Blastopirellula marina]PQO46053.1 hypothetical protein C5Y93_10770 [Blastopirellula marina]